MEMTDENSRNDDKVDESGDVEKVAKGCKIYKVAGFDFQWCMQKTLQVS